MNERRGSRSDRASREAHVGRTRAVGASATGTWPRPRSLRQRLVGRASRLGFKIVAATLLVAVIPLVVSTVLVGQVIRVSDSVAEGQARRLVEPINKGAQAYRLLFEQTKRAFRLQAQQLASDRRLRQLARTQPLPVEAVRSRLARLVAAQAELRRLGLKDSRGNELAAAGADAEEPAAQQRLLRVSRQVEGHPFSLEATFAADQAPFEDFAALGAAQRAASEITSLRGELTGYYRSAFLVMFGGALALATALSLLIARRTVKRVGVLVGATRTVAEGDLDTRVDLDVQDELGELAESFNEMVRQLRDSRERVAYLEKIGAWQEVARRLAHEIKNPLTPIQLAVQQLRQRYRAGDEGFGPVLSEACEIVTEEVEALRRLVGEFSAFSKLPTARLEPLDLEALLDDFSKSHAELIERAGARWQATGGECLVAADRMLLKHVLYNLVDNAVAVHADSQNRSALRVEIIVRRSSTGRFVTLEVRDNGPGMDAATAERVFDPYFTQRSNGTGLGLAIVKKIILEHRGTVAVQSTPGSGACFSLRLPLLPTNEAKRH
jgi:two-component system nitrogen regulation sensor histidine kinase NtrY